MNFFFKNKLYIEPSFLHSWLNFYFGHNFWVVVDKKIPFKSTQSDKTMAKAFKFFSSSYVLVMMTVDRYLAICFPLTNPPWTSRESKLVSWKNVLSNIFLFVKMLKIINKATKMIIKMLGWIYVHYRPHWL